MKNAAKPPRTKTTTVSKLKMPQFMAFARSESDLPKQVAQASAEWGAARIRAASSARKSERGLPMRRTLSVGEKVPGLSAEALAKAEGGWRGFRARSPFIRAPLRVVFIPSQVTDVFEFSQNDFEIDQQGDARQGRTNRV